MSLIHHMTSLDHMFKELYELMGKSPSQEVTTLPCLVVMGLVQEEI